VKDIFEAAAGSVTGRLHSQSLNRRNNQDAFSFQMTDRSFAGIVCDGCGSSPHSEIGAKLASKLLTTSIQRQLQTLGNPLDMTTVSTILETSQQELLTAIRRLAQDMGGSFSEAITEYFLFSTIGFLGTQDTVAIFSLGDGVFFVNDEKTEIGPFPNNAPPYLAYSLVSSSLTPNFLKFQIERIMPTSSLQNLLVGTDGTSDLCLIAENNLPGQDELVGPVSQFWEQNRYFKNPDMIRRRLALINNETTNVIWDEGVLDKHHGLLPDDTTVICMRRKEL